MTLRQRHLAAWLLVWASAVLVSSWLLSRSELTNLQEAFDTDARIVHRLLSQRAVQHDAILQTLVLLKAGAASGSMAQRLPSVYPQILSVTSTDAGVPWQDPPLRMAQDLSGQASRPVLVDANLLEGRYRMLLAGPDSSYALTIDARGMVPWNDWPMDAGSSPVQVALRYGEQELLLQRGRLNSSGQGGWNFSAQKELAAASQPFMVVSRLHVGWSSLPWTSMALAALAWALVLALMRFLIVQRQGRRLSEERLRVGQLNRLNTMGELAAGMAHELNQPLTAVLANTQAAYRMLSEEHLDVPLMQQALQQSVQQARRAAEVVGRLRRAVERPGASAEVHDVNPMELSRKALYLLEPELQRSRITPQLQWVGPPFEVACDAIAMEQILHNLLTNALHALEQVPPEQRTLRIVLQREATKGALTVVDSGPGIPPDALPHLFEPFFTTREGGLGLGLSLCETLASGMGGSLTASPGAKGGAEFCLRLPLANTTLKEVS
jgi:signal transduction histidine kinase